MNKQEHLLVIVAEEAVEVAQRATKALRFGMQQIQIDRNEPSPNSQNPLARTNKERLEDELCDLLATCELAGIQVDLAKFNERMAMKRRKVETYLEFSRQQGTLS